MNERSTLRCKTQPLKQVAEQYLVSLTIVDSEVVLRGSLGLAYVQLSCVTDVGLVCVVERYDLTELKE